MDTSMIDKDYEDNKNKESILKLLKIIKKNNADSNIQIKLSNLEKRIEKNRR